LQQHEFCRHPAFSCQTGQHQQRHKPGADNAELQRRQDGQRTAWPRCAPGAQCPAHIESSRSSAPLRMTRRALRRCRRLCGTHAMQPHWSHRHAHAARCPHPGRPEKSQKRKPKDQDIAVRSGWRSQRDWRACRKTGPSRQIILPPPASGYRAIAPACQNVHFRLSRAAVI
jgi:hypothetical protein